MRILTTIAIATSFVAAQNIDLGNIVVTATKSEQKLQDVTSNVTIITKDDLNSWHVSSLSEALEKVSGVSVAQNGGLGQPASFYLRGFDSKYTLVLVDGVRLNDPSAIGASANISNILLNDVERIEIIKGAQSGIYGADAVAGVINIITKKANKGCGSFNANFEYGKYKTKKSFLSISKKYGALSTYIGYSYLKSDGFSAAADIDKDLNSYEDDKYENRNFNVKVGYDVTANDKVNLEFSKLEANTDFDAGAKLDSTIATVIETDKVAKASYTHNYSKDSYSKLYYSKSDFLRAYTLDFAGVPTLMVYNAEIKELGLDNKVSFGNVDAVFGVDRKVSKDKISNKSLKSTGVYATAIAKIDNSIVTATLRRDNYSNYQNKTTGKIGVRHNFANGLSVSANYGTAYKVPTLSELYSPFGGNKDLKPETIKSFDISAEYKNFTVTYFDNKIDDAIIYSYNPATYTGAYLNSTKKSKIKGYEISYKNAISDDLLLSLNYTRFNAKDTDGYQLARRPKFTANVSVDYYGFENTHINLNAQYIGKRVEYAYGTHNVVANTGNIFVANLSADYKINENVTAYLKVNNITDKKYQNVNGYATSGRAVYVGVNAKF